VPELTERVRNRLIARVWDLHEEYKAEVVKSALTQSSQYDLIYFSELFVRWLENDYTPGQGL
jgi:hypothetical protein